MSQMLSPVFSMDLQQKCRYAAGAFLLGIVLLAGSVTPVYPVTVECIPESCPCDPVIQEEMGKCVRVKTGNCCKQPDCEFFEAIVEARAWRNVHQRIKQRRLGILDPAHEKMWYRSMRETEMAKEHAKYAKCPKNYLNRTPELVAHEVNDCAIEELGKRGAITLEDLQQNSNACSEVVAAEWAEAQRDAEFCDELVKAGEDEDLSTFLDQELARTEAKIDSLEDSLWTYYHRCTDILGAKMQREVADKGLSALINKAMPKPPKKAKPKKSGKKKAKSAKSR